MHGPVRRSVKLVAHMHAMQPPISQISARHRMKGPEAPNSVAVRVEPSKSSSLSRHNCLYLLSRTPPLYSVARKCAQLAPTRDHHLLGLLACTKPGSTSIHEFAQSVAHLLNASLGNVSLTAHVSSVVEHMRIHRFQRCAEENER